MKKKATGRRLVCLLLAVCTVAVLAACGQGTEETVTTTAGIVSGTESDTVTEPAVTGRADRKDDLPEDLDLGNATVRVAYRGGTDAQEIRSDTLVGELVSDAVYERNKGLEQRLNFHFEYYPFGSSTTGAVPSQFTTSVQAGDCEYDLLAWSQYACFELATKGLYYNLYDVEYLNFDQPWWNTDYMETVDLGTKKRFFAMGDISLSSIQVSGAVFYNKSLYADVFGTGETLYQVVEDHKWTLDKMYEVCEAAYVDLNGNGVVDLDQDQLGAAVTKVANTDLMAYALGFHVFERDENNQPVYMANAEQNVNVAEKMKHFYYQCKGVYSDVNDTYVFNSNNMANTFMAGRILLMPAWLKSCEYLRNMDDYGIVPYPLYDESQEQYLAMIQDTGTVFSIPSTSQRADDISAVMEAWCAENYRTVYPAYYETALKLKYSPDEISSQMIDLIHDGAITDLGYAYNYALTSIGTVMRNVMASSGNSYATLIKALDKMVKKNMDVLSATFMD